MVDKLSYWTILYKVRSLKSNEPSLLYNIGEFVPRGYIEIKKSRCIFYIEVAQPPACDEDISKEIAIAEGHILANIISWERNTYVIQKRVKKSSQKKFSSISSTAKIDTNFSYKTLFSGIVSVKNFEIIEAFRQIKNEKNKTLRYLMYYRLLEVFASDYRIKEVDGLIDYHQISVHRVNDARNHRKSKTIITHFRNFIHPVRKSYLFPYQLLSSSYVHAPIDRITRNIIRKIIS